MGWFLNEGWVQVGPKLNCLVVLLQLHIHTCSHTHLSTHLGWRPCETLSYFTLGEHYFRMQRSGLNEGLHSKPLQRAETLSTVTSGSAFKTLLHGKVEKSNQEVNIYLSLCTRPHPPKRLSAMVTGSTF